MKSSIVVLKDSDASHSDARIQTHQRALFLVVRHAEPAFIRVHVPRALGPFFFSIFPFFFPHCAASSQRGGRRGRLRAASCWRSFDVQFGGGGGEEEV